MPRKYLAPSPADEARIRVRSTGHDIERNGNGHAITNGQAHHRNGDAFTDVA
jgi:hypothetical protein